MRSAPRTDCMECSGTGMPGGCPWCGVKEAVDHSYDLAELQTTVGEILVRLEALERAMATRTDCMECSGTGMPGGCPWCGVKEAVDHSYDLAELQMTVGEILVRLEALERAMATKNDT